MNVKQTTSATSGTFVLKSNKRRKSTRTWVELIDEEDYKLIASSLLFIFSHSSNWRVGERVKERTVQVGRRVKNTWRVEQIESRISFQLFSSHLALSEWHLFISARKWDGRNGRETERRREQDWQSAKRRNDSRRRRRGTRIRKWVCHFCWLGSCSNFKSCDDEHVLRHWSHSRTCWTELKVLCSIDSELWSSFGTDPNVFCLSKARKADTKTNDNNCKIGM